MASSFPPPPSKSLSSSLPQKDDDSTTNKTFYSFPYSPPYEQQIQFMSKAYECCRNGIPIGAFESPTGTGKTLSILCSALTWMEDRNRLLRAGKVEEADGRVNERLVLSKEEGVEGEETPQVLGEEEEPDWMKNFIDEKESKEAMNTFEKRMKKREETMKRIKLREQRKLTRLSGEGRGMEEEEEKRRTTTVKYRSEKKQKRDHLREHLFSDAGSTNEERKSHGKEETEEEERHKDPEQYKLYEELEFLPSDVENEDAEKDDLDVFSSDDENDKDSDSDSESMLPITRIIFCSRTHSQLSQCVSELKRTRFRESVSSAAIASRKQLCVNPKVNNGLMSAQRINETCLDLRKSSASTSASTTKDKEKKKKKKGEKKEKGCPYLVSRSKATRALADRALVQPLDIEELSSMATKTKSCAYYAARQASKNADIIFMPYASLLAPDTRDALGIELDPKNTVVIFDEAHNVADAVRSSSSASMTRRDVNRAISMIENYIDRFKERLTADNLRVLKVLLSVAKRLVSVLTMSSTEKEKKTNRKKLSSLNDFLFSAKLDDVNVFELVRFLKQTKIAQKIAGYGEYVEQMKENGVDAYGTIGSDDRDWSGAWEGAKTVITDVRMETLDTDAGLEARVVTTKKNQHSANVASVHAMANFIHALGSEDADGRVLVEKMYGTEEEESSVKFVLLDVASRFREDIVKKCRATLLVGGTLAPFEELLTQLVGYKESGILSSNDADITSSSSPLSPLSPKPMLFSCDHVVDKSNVLPLAIAKGPSGKTFDFTSKNLKLCENDLLDDLGRCVLNLSKVCVKTGGVIVFFPSFSLMDRCFQRWQSNSNNANTADASSMLQMMRKVGKTVLKEPRDNAQLERTLFQFSSACGGENPTYELASKTGAILLCVVNGKLSEGINFKDNLGRMVIVVGLPFANVKDEELSARMEYLDIQQKQAANNSSSSLTAGRAYYEALCARGVNQSVGRAIRHKDDYATMIFLDQRWCEKDKRNTTTTTQNTALGKYQQTLPGWISRELKVVDGNFGEAVRHVAQFFKAKCKVSRGP